RGGFHRSPFTAPVEQLHSCGNATPASDSASHECRDFNRLRAEAGRGKMVSNLAGTKMLPGPDRVGETDLCHRDSSAECNRGVDDGARFEQYHPGYSGTAGPCAGARGALAA